MTGHPMPGYYEGRQEFAAHMRFTAAALDYAETALSECWAVLRRIAAGEPNPAQVAADLLEAHGHEGIGA